MRVAQATLVALILSTGCGGASSSVNPSTLSPDTGDLDAGNVPDSGVRFGEVEQMATAQGEPVALTHDGDDLYWLDRIGTESEEHTYRFMRTSLGGLGTDMVHQIAETASVTVTSLAVHAPDLYWIQQQNGKTRSLMRRPLEGGASELVNQSVSQNAEWLVAADDGIWFSGLSTQDSQTQGTLFRLPYGTKSPVTVAYAADEPGAAPTSMTFVGDTVAFVLGGNYVYFAPRAGNTVRATSTRIAGPLQYVGTDGVNTYIVATGGDHNAIVEIAGSTASTIFTGMSTAAIGGFAANARHLFWTEPAAIRTMPAGGGEARELVRDQLDAWKLLDATPTHLYWVDGSAIMRVGAP